MSDLIININLNESRRKQRLLIEIYEGEIPNLKSKKFSGQLRNVNLSSVSSVDNLSLDDLKEIKDIFNSAYNMQISKFQYLFSMNCLSYLEPFIDRGCVFCKDGRKSPMYRIERLLLNTQNAQLESIGDFSVFQDGSVLFIDYNIENKEEVRDEIVPQFYINIMSEEYLSELFFDYGKDLVGADDKEICLVDKSGCRDYKFEKYIISEIKEAHWKKMEKNSFAYIGKNIFKDMQKLSAIGISLYTNNKKKITVADFSNINVSYGLDWFELSGTVKAGDNEIKLGDLIDFRKKKRKMD